MELTAEQERMAVENTVMETFAEMAFLDVMPSETANQFGNSQGFAVDISGAEQLRCYLDMSVSAKHSVVENIHADAWTELNSEEIDDCLLEILNVLGGTLGRALWGEAVRCKLGFPEVVVMIPGRDDDVHVFDFDAEGEPLTVILERPW